MFARVRRSDLALTVVALAGLAAGLALTIVKTLGVTGPVLIGVGIATAVAAVVSGARSQISQVLDRQNQQNDSLAGILAAPVKPLREIDPFTIGVFPSALAERARQDRSGPEDGRIDVPPYVHRGVDAALRRALEESSLSAAGRLVVLRGDPKSGKSRSLWEAVQMLPERRLLAVTYPDPAAAPTDPTYEPLATLAGLDRPVSMSKGRDLVIWVDDAHRHLRHGLTRSSLRRLTALYPKAVIVMTIHNHELDGLRDVDPYLHALLRRPFDDLFLGPELSLSELVSARSAYPALADDADLARLPELFAAVNLLIERYQHHRADQPVGVAVAKAAIDWQRAGMPPGSIDEPTVRALAELTLADIAPNQVLDDEAFKCGLDWAGEEIAVFAALIRRETASGPEFRRYRAFDAVVSWAHHHEAPVSHKIWNFVLAKAGDRDLLGVGISAYLAGEWGIAIDAFQRAALSVNSQIAAGALIGKAISLGGLGQHEDELATYDEVVERFGDAEDPALAQHAAVALVSKGLTFGRLNRPEDEIAAYDQVAVRFGDAKDPALAEQVVVALSRRGSQLRHPGREDELAANDQMLERAVGPDSISAHRGDRAVAVGSTYGTAVPPEEAARIIHLLSEEFMLLHLRSQVEAFRARWPELGGLPPEELASLRPLTSGPPGLGYARADEIDGIVGVIAWSVITVPARRFRIGRERGRIRRVADERHLRPEVSDALARFLTDRLGHATADHTLRAGPDTGI